LSNALDIGNKNNGLRCSLETFDVSMQVMRRTISEGLKQACDRYHQLGLIFRAEKGDRPAPVLPRLAGQVVVLVGDRTSTASEVV
jgi:hypothetical protein